MNANVLILIGSFLLGIAGIRASGATTPDASLALRVSKGTSWNCLRLELMNRTSEQLDLPLRALPWSSRSALFLHAVNAETKMSVPSASILMIPPSGKVTLDAGQTLSAHIDIRNYFEGSEAVVARTDMIIFWAYQFDDNRGPRYGKDQGAIRIDRSAFRGQTCAN